MNFQIWALGSYECAVHVVPNLGVLHSSNLRECTISTNRISEKVGDTRHTDCFFLKRQPVRIDNHNIRRSDKPRDALGALMPVDRPLIVHSHLRWDFVWQRPQQIVSRLAEHRPVLFVEEPVFLDDIKQPHLPIEIPYANVFRAIPRLPGKMREDCERGTAEIRSLIQQVISAEGQLKGLFNNPVQWFYSPFTAPAMLGAFNETAVVYDCMDELAQFRYEHPDLARRERLLLANADLVFAGGYRLFESKRR